MILGLLSVDDANRETAKLLADDAGFRLQGWLPKDGPPDDRFDALIYDLDFWAFNHRQRDQLVEALNTEPPNRPLAVHSFNLTHEQGEALDANGVIVSRRLDAELFDRLVGALAVFPLAREERAPEPAAAAS